MKKYKNLYSKIICPSNIINAHINARKGKTHYKEVIEVDENIDYYMEEVYRFLKEKSYKVSDYIIFQRQDKGKTRELYKLPYFP